MFQVRVVQYKEPQHFMAMFGGRMIVFQVRYEVSFLAVCEHQMILFDSLRKFVSRMMFLNLLY